MSSSAILFGACAFVHRDSSPIRLTFDRMAPPQLIASVTDLEISSYCVEENKPISTVLSFQDCELIVIAVAHRNHTVIVAWHTPLFMDLLAIVQGQRYDAPDGLRNNIMAGVPPHNPRAPLPPRMIHPFANYPYVPLLRSFGYDGLRMLLALAASDNTVIFLGDTLSTPSLCCFGLRAALQPLEWLGLFAPVCDPFDIANTIANETCIVGTHSSAAPSLLLAHKPKTFIANCNTSVIAPTAYSATVYVFPPSEKLKTALGDGSDLAEGIFSYWATHCIGQYRKGLSGRSFDPFKCLFHTTAGSSRERLARNVSSSPAFSRWLTSTLKDEARAPLTEHCVKLFPELYPDMGHKAKASVGLSLFAKAKQTIRSMTTDVDVRLTQYMTSPDVFGHGSGGDDGMMGGPMGPSDAARLPLDCLINFEAYQTLLTPARCSVRASGAAPPSAVTSSQPIPHRRTGMSVAKVEPPKTMSIASNPSQETGTTNAISESAKIVSRPTSPPPVTDVHREVLDLTELKRPSPPPQDIAPPVATLASVQQPQQGKYDAFEELQKLQVNKPPTPQPQPEPEVQKKTMTLDDFFQ